MKILIFTLLMLLLTSNIRAQTLTETLDYVNARISKTTDYINRISVTKEGFILGEGDFWNDTKKVNFKIVYKALPSELNFKKNRSDYRLTCKFDNDCFITENIFKDVNPDVVEKKAYFFRFTIELLSPDEIKAFEYALNNLLNLAVEKNRIFIDTKTKKDPFMVKVKNNENE